MHRRHYYDLLQQVREKGDWELWLSFFLEGIAETSVQAADAAREILNLFETDRRRIETLGRPAASALRVHELLQTKPIIAIPDTAKRLGISAPTVAKSVQHLVKIGIAREITGKQRRRFFAYPGYLRIIERGTKPISK